MIAGAVFGSICSDACVPLIQYGFGIEQELPAAFKYLLPIMISFLILIWFLKIHKKNNKGLLICKKVPNEKLISTILQDFCNKYEKEILDNKFPPSTK